MIRTLAATAIALSATLLLVGCGDDDADSGTTASTSSSGDAVDTSGTVRGGNHVMFGEWDVEVPDGVTIVSNVAKLTVPAEGGPVEGSGTIVTRHRGFYEPRECNYNYKSITEITMDGSWPGRNWQEVSEAGEPGDADDLDGLIDEVLDGGDGVTPEDVVANLDLTSNLTLPSFGGDEGCTFTQTAPNTKGKAKAAINISNDAIYAIAMAEPVGDPSRFNSVTGFKVSASG